MTSGGDTNNDLNYECTLSAKNHEENLNAELHTNQLKNHCLPESVRQHRVMAHFLGVQFSTVFALSFSNCSPYESARPETREGPSPQPGFARLICWATPLALTSICLNPFLPASFCNVDSKERAVRLSPPNNAISPCASRASNCSPGIPSFLASETTESNSFFPAASFPERICRRPEVMATASLTAMSSGES